MSASGSRPNRRAMARNPVATIFRHRSSSVAAGRGAPGHWSPLDPPVGVAPVLLGLAEKKGSKGGAGQSLSETGGRDGLVNGWKDQKFRAAAKSNGAFEGAARFSSGAGTPIRIHVSKSAICSGLRRAL